MKSLLRRRRVPIEHAGDESHALPAEGTRAAETSSDLAGDDSERVALVPLADGNDALGARLQMIESAERSIDIKTFLIKADVAGKLIWVKLYEAAERGVRIRLLYDDVFTTARDDQIATLNAHPNVEIRTFNPLSRKTPLVLNFLLDFKRVNRRMHNKAMIADGAFAIIGGRNIADEYYQIGIDHEFADFDLFFTGQPVRELSSAFDLFWNDTWSSPLSARTSSDDTPILEALKGFREVADSSEVQTYQRAMNSSYLADVRNGRIPHFTGRGRIVVDTPEKLRAPPAKGPFIVCDEIFQTMAKAQREVLLLTPYFIPERSGAEFFKALVKRGVRVRIATNSLASTNHPYVHGAYSKYRNRLLPGGVEFLEARADAAILMGSARKKLTMHTKLLVVDDRFVFVGSSNFDPRSHRQNTEIGMLIDSPDLASRMRERVEVIGKDYTFSLRHGATGNTTWHYDGSERQEILHREPRSGPWRVIQSIVAGWLPIESQL